MKFTFFKILGLLSLCYLFACGKSPVVGVEQAFAEYQQAIGSQQYGKAANMMDRKSLDYYDHIAKLALESERSKLGAINFNTKLITLALRQEFSKSELQDLSGRQVYEFAARNHLNPLDSIQHYKLAKTVLQSGMSKAVSRLSLNGELTDSYLKFIKEDGIWKLNFATIMNDENKEKTNVEVTGINEENRRALKIVADISKKRIKRNIWVPANRW